MPRTDVGDEGSKCFMKIGTGRDAVQCSMLGKVGLKLRAVDVGPALTRTQVHGLQ